MQEGNEHSLFILAATFVIIFVIVCVSLSTKCDCKQKGQVTKPTATMKGSDHVSLSTPLLVEVERTRQTIHKRSMTSPLRFYRIFVISLPNTELGQVRWTYMKKTVFAPYMEQFPGIYGRTYDYEPEVQEGIVSKSWDYGRWKHGISRVIPMTPGEIGVSLSHYYLWKKIVTENIPQTIILEDDSFNVDADFENKFQIVVRNAPENWDILLISFWLHQGEKGYAVNKIISKTHDFVFLNCYMITKRGAEKLLNCGTINMPVDSWISKQSHVVNIYRHHYQSTGPRPRGILISQGDKSLVGSSIDHTNNW